MRRASASWPASRDQPEQPEGAGRAALREAAHPGPGRRQAPSDEDRLVDRRRHARAAYGTVRSAGACSSTARCRSSRAPTSTPLPRFVNPATGRVHCSFSQASPPPGGCASSDPNLQNIPIRTDARPAHARAPSSPRADELGAALAPTTARSSCASWRTSRATSACARPSARGKDIHARDRRACLRRQPEARDARDAQPRQGGQLRPALRHGRGASARETGLSIAEARASSSATSRRFPKRARLAGARSCRVRARRATSRRCSAAAAAWPTSTPRRPRARLAENAAVNTPMQGSAADIIKLAMIDLERRLARRGLPARLLLQVHDELLVEVPLAEIDATIALVRTAWSTPSSSPCRSRSTSATGRLARGAALTGESGNTESTEIATRARREGRDNRSFGRVSRGFTRSDRGGSATGARADRDSLRQSRAVERHRLRTFPRSDLVRTDGCNATSPEIRARSFAHSRGAGQVVICDRSSCDSERRLLACPSRA